MIKKVLAAAVALAVLLAAVTVASADHSWSVYHWEKTGATVSPTVKDKTSSNLWDFPNADVGEEVDEWASFNDFIKPTLTTAKKGNITVSEQTSQFWLGLARIFIDDNGHITKGEVKLNTTYLAYYEANGYPGIAEHVLCQELGHVLGLGHNRDGDTGGIPDDSCMNDQGHLGEYTSPNSHDTDQLNAIYTHTHAGGTTETDDGGPDCGKNTNAKQCRSGNGFWITVDIFPLP